MRNGRPLALVLGWPSVSATVLLLFLAAVCSIAADRVLMVVRVGGAPSFFIPNEARPMIGQLEAAGYDIEVATLRGEPVSGALDSDQLNSDVKLSDVQLNRYVAIVIPCMDASNIRVPKEIAALVKEADSLSMPIAAQHSFEVFAAAGMTTRKIAMSPGVVVDSNLVTSYNCPVTARDNAKPIDTDELIRTLIAVLRSR